jgi:hypothetical protein
MPLQRRVELGRRAHVYLETRLEGHEGVRLGRECWPPRRGRVVDLVAELALRLEHGVRRLPRRQRAPLALRVAARRGRAQEACRCRDGRRVAAHAARAIQQQVDVLEVQIDGVDDGAEAVKVVGQRRELGHARLRAVHGRYQRLQRAEHARGERADGLLELGKALAELVVVARGQRVGGARACSLRQRVSPWRIARGSHLLRAWKAAA